MINGYQTRMLVALRDIRVSGTVIEVGQPFECTEIDASYYIKTKRARSLEDEDLPPNTPSSSIVQPEPSVQEPPPAVSVVQEEETSSSFQPAESEKIQEPTQEQQSESAEAVVGVAEQQASEASAESETPSAQMTPASSAPRRPRLRPRGAAAAAADEASGT